MMHLSTEQLLALDNGDPDPGWAAHLEGCDICRREAGRIGRIRNELADLPEVGPGADLWPSIEAAAVRERRRRRAWLQAAAAILVAVAAATVVTLRTGRESATAVSPRSPVGDRVAVEQLVEASRSLEALLERPALRSSVMGPRQAAMIVELEDGIAGIDARLMARAEPASEEEQLELWSQRVRLLAALVQTRGAPDSVGPIQHAVYGRGSTS